MDSTLMHDGFHLASIARLCREIGSPTEGQLAEFLWRFSNRSDLSHDVADSFMRAAGYTPFVGYPLQRNEVKETSGEPPNAEEFASGEFIAWCDGGSRGNPGPAAYGVIIKTHSGSKVTSFNLFLGNQTNNFAEYQGLLAALSYAMANGIKRLRLRSDSELVVNQVLGHYKVRDLTLKKFYDEAIALIQQFSSCEIEHIRREYNTEADALVNKALDAARSPSPSEVANEHCLQNWWNSLAVERRVDVLCLLPVRNSEQRELFSGRCWHELHGWMRQDLRKLHRIMNMAVDVLEA